MIPPIGRGWKPLHLVDRGEGRRYVAGPSRHRGSWALWNILVQDRLVPNVVGNKI
jgi:hypothetical protein